MFERTRPKGRTRTAPRIIPPNGGMSSRPRPLAGGPAVTQELPVVGPDALTQVLPRVRPSDLPAVYQHTSPVPATALAGTLPLPPSYLPVPPSARHLDPAAWHDRTHVEDNDLEPQGRGRHAIDVLKAVEDDVVAGLLAVQQRAHTALDAYDPMRQAENLARANDERMRAFAASWDAWETRYERSFESWARRFKDALAATRAAWAVTSGRTNAARLAMDYNAGGTSAALYTKDQLAQEIARREQIESGVAS